MDDYEASKLMVKTVREELGPIDILVNNAAILRDKYLINMEARDWIDVINTNLVGVFNVTKNVAFSMMRRKKGKIINIASLNAITGSLGQTNYTASKGGVISFTKSLSKELAPFGINVNAVAAGLYRNRNAGFYPRGYIERLLKPYSNRQVWETGGDCQSGPVFGLCHVRLYFRTNNTNRWWNSLSHGM